MEIIGNFIIAHSSTVILALSGGVLLCVFALLMISFHSPKDAIASELGSAQMENVLRQILSEQDWPKVQKPEVVSADSEVSESSSAEENSVSGSEGTPVVDEEAAKLAAEQEALKAAEEARVQAKVKELEEKLAEYSVIEEDIADLSRFRQENEELRKKITHVTGLSADDAAKMPWDEFEKVVKEKEAAPAAEGAATQIENAES